MITPSRNLEQLTETFLNEGLTVREKEELQALLKESENKDYFKRMYLIWHNTHHTGDEEYVEKALQRTLFRLDKQPQPSDSRQKKSGWRFSFLKLAAAVVISFILGAISYICKYPGKFGVGRIFVCTFRRPKLGCG